MKLNVQGLQDRTPWQQAGFALPEFDRQAMVEQTKKTPRWIHFGAGNIFRAFLARGVQTLLDAGKMDTGLIAVGGRDPEVIPNTYHLYDNYSILVTLKSDGTAEKTVLGSVAEALNPDLQQQPSASRLREIFRNPSLQMVSFTITEKGYSLMGKTDGILPEIARDFENGPENPESYMGRLTALLLERFLAGGQSIALVSMDNCSHNGEKLFQAVHSFAKAWAERGLVSQDFLTWLEDPKTVSFPWSMIDKITPQPDAQIQALLEADGVENAAPVYTARKACCAPYVNAEECEYLVVEDAFPNGRPPLEAAGIYMADRDTVEKAEKMKVSTCLNPLHTTLAVFGCLLGYRRISEEMKNPVLHKLVEDLGYLECLPVSADPGILRPEEFLRTVLEVRIPNPFLPDTPQRIACDTSQKLPIRFGQTIRAYLESDTRNVRELTRIPLVFAGWLRYLMGVDDQGQRFELSPDPLLDRVCPYVENFRLGETRNVREAVLPLLKDQRIFGVDLEAAGLADLVCRDLEAMLEGPGAVLRTLKQAAGF